MVSCCKVLLAISILLPVLFGYLTYVPIPDDVEDKKTVRVAMTILKCVGHIGYMSELLGIKSRPEVERYLLTFLLPPKPKFDSSVKLVKDKVAGVDVYKYLPNEKVNVLTPAVVYFHGGAWFMGSADLLDPFTRNMCRRLKIPVISVNYRLAPENPFPAGLDDCFSVTKYILEHGEKMGIDTNKIIVMGDSAGGNLAAAVSLKLREVKDLPKIYLQVLLCPLLQVVDFQLPAYQYTEKYPLITVNKGTAYVTMLYCNEPVSYSLARKIGKNGHVTVDFHKKYGKFVNHDFIPDQFKNGYKRFTPHSQDIIKVSDNFINCITNPLVSPLLAESLTNLPEALIITAGHDGLRDEGFIYSKRLEIDGVKSTVKNFPHSTHDDIVFPKIHRSESEAYAFLMEFLSKKLVKSQL